VGDVISCQCGKLVKSAGFDAVMAELVAAPPDVPVVLDMVRPIPDRDVDFASLSEDTARLVFSRCALTAHARGKEQRT
jgi:hypothetical protein